MDYNDENKNNLPLTFTLFSGALAGAIAKTAVAPLHTAKIIIIKNQQGMTFSSLVEIIVNIKNKYGYRGLWRGNTATVLRIIPYASCRFYLYEFIKNYLETRSTSNLKNFIAGSIVGICSLTISYPFDTIRSRMAVTNNQRYKNLKDAIHKMYHEEGIQSFYRGYSPTLIGVIPYAGLSFFVFELFKYEYKRINPKNKDINIVHRLVFGGIAGLLATFFSYPFDVVRHCFQVDGVDGAPYKFKKVIPTFKHIYTTSGLRNGLFGGLSINIIKGPIATAISFCIYDTLSTTFKKYHNHNQDHS